jgi:AcrR family transcriptional regulator
MGAMAGRRGLTRDRILDVALELADAEGLEAVGMRAIAQRLGVTPMALYRHVGDKDALLDGLVERLLGEVEGELERSDDEGPWERRLQARGAALREVARAHPTAFPLLLARRARTPGARRTRDSVVAALTDAGVPPDDAPRLERLLATFALGFAAAEAGGRFDDTEAADADFAYAERLLLALVQLAAGRAPDPR